MVFLVHLTVIQLIKKDHDITESEGSKLSSQNSKIGTVHIQFPNISVPESSQLSTRN